MNGFVLFGRTVEIVLLYAWAIFSAYLLLLTVAATGRRPMAPASAPPLRRLGVLIPAHDEELSLGAALGSLALQRYPRDRFEVIVIADNCRDRTADIARNAGATVMERSDPGKRGKGHALAWTLDRLSRSDSPHDAYVIVDADSLTSPNLLEVMNRFLGEGWEAIQVHNAVGNPGQTWMTALRFASFASYSYLRPLGRTWLGFTAKLQGNGMGLATSLLRRHRWESFALAEDFDYSAGLAALGVRVAFAKEAEVRSDMPLTLDQAHTQVARWELGRWQVLRRHVPRLLGIALRERSLWRAEAALDLLTPPLSFLIGLPAFFVALDAGLFALGRVGAWSGTLAALWSGVLVACLVHLLVALLLVRAPAFVYRALLCAPIYLVKLIRINLAVLLGRGEKGWARTPRAGGKAE